MVEHQTLQVDGMGCEGCEDSVESALQKVAGVRGAEADQETGEVAIEVDEHTEENLEDLLREAVEEAGYQVAS